MKKRLVKIHLEHFNSYTRFTIMNDPNWNIHDNVTLNFGNVNFEGSFDVVDTLEGRETKHYLLKQKDA